MNDVRRRGLSMLRFGAGGSVKSVPIYDATAPISCTASSGEVSVRIEQMERMRSYLTRLERTEHGLLLYFPVRREIGNEVRAFTVDEKMCCAFWGFAITQTQDEIRLRWDGPPDVARFFDDLVLFLDGDAPLTAFSGVL